MKVQGLEKRKGILDTRSGELSGNFNKDAACWRLQGEGRRREKDEKI